MAILPRLFSRRSIRAAPKQQTVGVTSAVDVNYLRSFGYHAASDAPEVTGAIWRIADLVASMPIHLLRNTEDGDVRVHNRLARKLDIDPYSLGSRQSLVQWIVYTMLTTGEAVCIPITAGGQLLDIVPAPGATLFRNPGDRGYRVRHKSAEYSNEEILHFRLRPDPSDPWRGQSMEVNLQPVVDSLTQAQQTKTAYLSSEYKPPLIIAVNSDSDLADESQRRRFVNGYLKRRNPAEPWIIPADLMNVSQVKPLTLQDLALKDGVELDKSTVSTLLDIPKFLLGSGQFISAEYNAWISRRIMTIAQILQQELTAKLVPGPDMYVKLNPWGIYAYTLPELATIAMNLKNAGMMTGNEGRNWLSLPPLPGLNELTALENYIPVELAGNQAKLTQQKEDPNEP